MCVFKINLKEILANFNRAKARVNKGVKICAVVKADAYGFGVKKICTLLDKKTDYFAVARLSEFLQLEKLKVKKPILLLSPLLSSEQSVAVERGAELTVDSLKMLQCVNSIAKKKHKVAKIHLKLDTGMSRFGIKTLEELQEILMSLKKLENVRFVGFYSHLYDASSFLAAERCRDMFIEAREKVLEAGFKPIFHLANSEGLKDPSMQFDMVRLGFDLYDSKNNLHSFETFVIETKHLFKGESVSYDGTFVAPREMDIAICSAGYADGLSRSLSNRGYALIKGKRVKIIGTICMDVFMADITSLNQVMAGDRVILFGKWGENVISVCEMAELCDTIPYEVYTGLTSRTKRVYTWR